MYARKDEREYSLFLWTSAELAYRQVASKLLYYFHHARLNQLLTELRSASPIRAADRVSRGHSEEMLAAIRRQRGARGRLSQVSYETELQ